VATKFLDVKEAKKLTDPNPLAIAAFFVSFIIVTQLMSFGLFMLIVVALLYFFCLVVFSFPIRQVVLYFRYTLFSSEIMSPNFEDEEYIPNEDLLKNIQNLKGLNKKKETLYNSIPT
jgi:hypothetical protein